MTDDRPPLVLTLLKSLLSSSFVFAWGGALIWFAGDGSALGPEEASQHFSLVLMGMILIALGFVGMLYTVLKSRAPSRQKDRPTEAAEVVFDPDAAMERYLANRKQEEAVTPPPGPKLPARPVFGRRGGAPSQHG